MYIRGGRNERTLTGYETGAYVFTKEERMHLFCSRAGSNNRS